MVIKFSETITHRRKSAIPESESAHWLEENREALGSSNAWVEVHGLLLKDKRLF